MGKKELGPIRREYSMAFLDESSLPDDPLELFIVWLDQAQSSSNPDHTAMTLSTVEPNGQPSSRIVLLKKVLDGRLIFYTNYNSRKSREIRSQAKVATLFYWSELERQVRINGIARPVDDPDSDHYFQSRPFESNISTWASHQSEPISNRQYLEEEYKKYLKKFSSTKEVPRPAYWGGYAITPTMVEFWQGGQRRLHDRIEYTRKEKSWSRVRLAP